MAAPTFVQAGTGQVWTTGAGVAATLAAATVGNVVIVHINADDGTGLTVPTVTLSGIANLAGTANSVTLISHVSSNPSSGYGATADAGTHYISIGRATSTTPSATCSSSGADLYFRLYEFTGVNPGTAITDVIENSGTANGFENDIGTSTTISDTGVTTTGADRLALNFIAVNDDNQAFFDTEAFTGQTGGTWVSRGSYGSATGTDGSIGLQSAEMASAGTINGGTLTMDSDPWGVVGFALIPVSTTPKSYPFQPFTQTSNLYIR